MLKFFLIPSILLLGLWASPQENQTPPKAAPAAPDAVPAEAMRQINPVKTSSESIAQGKKWYGYDCAMCHGKEGNGKGDMAISMKLKMGDFATSATLKDRTDGELFYIIKNGKGQMPPEGERLKPAEIWNMVNYIRSITQKKATPDEKTPANNAPAQPRPGATGSIT